jgi:hypothetical protein
MRSAVYSTNTLCKIFIVLIPWNNSLWIDMSPDSDTLSWFRANQSLLFCCSLVEKQQIPMFMVFGFTWMWLKLTINHTQGEHTNHYATNAVPRVYM